MFGFERYNSSMSTARFTIAPIFLFIFLMSGCAGSAKTKADSLTPKQIERLEKQLAGKTAGKPVTCLSNQHHYQTIRVSDRILLYRISGKLVYRNDLRGICPGLARDNDILVFQHRGISSHCKGDLFYLADRSSGIRGASCVLGAFTPFRKTDPLQSSESQSSQSEQ